MTARRIIRGHDGPVEIDAVSRTVTKTYTSVTHDSARTKIERELEYAGRLRAALVGIDDLACARILSWDTGARPHITMSLCPGEPLSRFLLRLGGGDPRSGDIARKIHKGLTIYVRVFAEPYHDLSMQNLLYDDATGVLTFLDFGIPERADDRGLDCPLEGSLGTFVGCACYEMVRPARLFFPKAGYLDVISGVMKAFGGQISMPRVEMLACATFLRLTGAGTWARRNYYRTAGTILRNAYLRVLKLRPAPNTPA